MYTDVREIFVFFANFFSPSEQFSVYIYNRHFVLDVFCLYSSPNRSKQDVFGGIAAVKGVRLMPLRARFFFSEQEGR